MKLTHLVFITSAALLSFTANAADKPSPTCPTVFNQNIERLHSSKSENLCDHFNNNKAVLVVNTASHCGFTKQFSGLEKLYQKYKDQGLVVVGFPSNSFFQEEKTEEATASVCYKNYGVTFPMFTHVDVKGKNAHPVFQYLTQNSEKPSWNFNKYLVANNKVTHFGSRTTPMDSDLEEEIKKVLTAAN